MDKKATGSRVRLVRLGFLVCTDLPLPALRCGTALNTDTVQAILPLDIALRRDDREWFEILPREIEQRISHKLYYGHFFCHVLHQDYILRKGEDAAAIKAEMLKILDERGAEYPAEHNVGHLYTAKADLAAHYRACDPTNSMNPGLGKLSKRKNYA